MNPYIVLAIIAGAPIVILTLLRVNAATAFLALCLGSVLSSFVSADLLNLLRGYIAPDSEVMAMVIALMLLWAPVVLVSFFMIHTISHKQRLLNLLPCVAVGLLGVLMSVPLLTPSVQDAIYSTTLWDFAKQYQALIVLAGTVVSLVLLRMRAPLGEPHKGKH